MISKGDVVHIAKLARLELTEKEVEKMQKDLSSILEYFEVLKTAKKPLGAPSPQCLKENVVRKDEIIEKSAGLADSLVQAAPDKKDGYIKVKTVF